MFQWDFVRSAETIFSRWAIKRLCKFLLKKKLGEFILGDIDLDQLEVQLSRGTIQLSDLAVNVDYINHKLAGSAVVLKEGSIASLLIKIPWKLQNFQVELEELELVFAPVTGSKNHVSNSCFETSKTDKQQMNLDPDKIEPGTVQETCVSASLDIHEGVKTIAKIVKWILTSFHIRLKNFIVAFDPCLEANENGSPVHKSLVLRIAESEFGTCISEDIDKCHIPQADCFLGMAKLTNFVKFEGAVLEVLVMANIDKSSQPQYSSETSCNECSSSNLPLGRTIEILTSRSGGISGRMNLSIPWKNGSLDFHKVDASISFNPIELRLQPCTIEWIIFVWESMNHAGTAAKNVYFNKTDSSCSSSRLHNLSSLRNCGILSADTTEPSIKKLSEDLQSDMYCETFPEDLVSRTHVIQDWVPQSFKEDQMDLEQEYGASIDQFFECFDGWRSSHTSSGTNRLWNWTCSVFSAISVASNMASGSVHMPLEHNKTCVRATVEAFSFLLYFHDEDESIYDKDANQLCRLNHLSSPTGLTQNPLLDSQSFDSYVSCFSSMSVDQSTIAEPNPTALKIHHLDMKCRDVVFNFQIGSRRKDCQITVKHVKIDEYYKHRKVECFNTINQCDHILINETLKQNVLVALPPFPFLAEEYDSETSVEHNEEKYNDKFSSKEQFIKVGLLESFGNLNFHCVVYLEDSDGSSVSSTSFSVHFPPCILWFHFHLADSLLKLFKMVETYFKKNSENRVHLFDDFSCGKRLISCNDTGSSAVSIKTVPTGDCVQGNFVFTHTRIIFCFPMQITEDFGHLYPMEKFIILEHYPSLIAEKVLQSSHFPSKHLSSPNGNTCISTFSLHFEVGTFDIYLTDSTSKDATVDQSVPLHLKDVTAVKILSMTKRTGDQHSGTSIVYQKGPVTGPWMASRVWNLTTHDHRSRKVAGKDCEFSYVEAVNDFEKISSDIRQDLILSSEFFLQLSFSIIQLDLRSHDYKQLKHLLDIVMHGLSNEGSSDFSISEDRPLYKHDFSQATFIMDCDILDLRIFSDEVCNCTRSVPKELSGSWNSFRLVVEKFEIMCVSNIGGISATNFFRLIHGEGQLWGSIYNENGSTSVTIRDVLLVSCMNSASGRGCGDGANVLSFGSAGTTITYLCNPQLNCSYTSILIHCVTVVAPGGRLDWIHDLCSFVSLLSENESSGSDINQSNTSNCTTYEASFFLDLVDIALCYEPHFKRPVINGDNAYVGCDCTFELNQGVSEQFVGCLFAASSFSLSNHALSKSTTINYNIQLQDLGLLICQSSFLNNDYVGYDVNNLQKSGYVKVASGIFLLADLKLHGLQWEIECSDSHINFDTCHDTTDGLFRLIAQLQKLYAPDIEDALAHLQSRWNSVQQNHSTNSSNDSLDCPHSFCLDAEKNLPRSDDNSLSIGLLDGIIENAFYTTQRSDNHFNHSVNCHNNYNNGMNLNSNVSLVEGFSVKMASNASACTSGEEKSCSQGNVGLDNIEVVPLKEEYIPQLIESFYYSEVVTPSSPSKGTTSVDGQRRKPAYADVECGKGGWYKDGYLMILDNHIPNTILLDSVQRQEECKVVSVDSDASANCSEKGKILLKNIDVRWRMFTGSDWSKSMKNSTGKDGSLSLELILSGMNIHYAVHPDGEVKVSKLSVHVQDFNLYDQSANAPWKMVIGHYNSKDHPRESYAKAFKLDLDTVRPDPLIPIEDYRLYLEILPLRLHLDQSQINFLISFFGDRSSVEESPHKSKDVDRSCISLKKNKAYESLTVVEEALLPFFQKCDVKPLVVRVDYIPHHMDLTSLRNGNYAELLNLVPWKGIELHLKQVCAVGLYGWASVCETVVGQWLEDISHNQIHKLLNGLAPVRSLVSVAAGTSKLVSLPVKSYRRDKKLLKGMQRGAIAFFKSISLEALGLGVQLASGAHEILLQTEYILTNVPHYIPSPSEKGRISKLSVSNQPEDAQEGIRQAYESLSDGLSRTASGLIGTPIKEYQRGAGAGLALATAIRAAPAAAIAPVTASAHAMHCALLGMRNSLDPEHRKESMNKYLGPSRP